MPGAFAAEKEVVPEEKPYHLEADVTEAFTSGTDRVIHGIGHVVIIHGDMTINCDEAYSYETQNMATLLGNVRVKDKVQKYTLTSGYAEYHRDKKLAVATKGPVLVLTKDRPITITADLMRMWTDKDYGEAAGNAHIVSEDVVGDGQTLKYFGKEDKVELTGEPVVSQKDSRLAADVITLFLKEDKLDRALAEGSARLVYFSRPEKEKGTAGGTASGGGENMAPPGENGAAGATPPEGEAGKSPGTPLEGGSEGVVEPGGEEEPTSPDEPPAPAEVENAAPGVTAAEESAPETSGGGPPAEGTKAGPGEAEKEPPSGRVEAAGAKMEAFFKDGNLDLVDIRGDAEGHYWPFDELGRETGEKIDAAGDDIRIMMAAGDVKKIVINGNAEGIYRPAKAEGRSGVTQTSGDRISVFITDREVRRIVVYGHAHGSYFTEETPAAEEGPKTGG